MTGLLLLEKWILYLDPFIVCILVGATALLRSNISLMISDHFRCSENNELVYIRK